ncbi:hypothetical protein KC216_20595, partial [Mycobacterium tuberculosis]|nr:hypothetical protein [Mycobacterium tuberculosis]
AMTAVNATPEINDKRIVSSLNFLLRGLRGRKIVRRCKKFYCLYGRLSATIHDNPESIVEII